MSINLNQFKLEQEVGNVDLTFFGGENVMSVLLNPGETSTDTYVPGEGVKLIDLGASDQVGLPIVGKRTSDADPIFGVIKRNTKYSKASPGDRVEIALAGCPMWLKSDSALNRGVGVSLVEATPGNVQAVSTHAKLGVTLDKISAGGIGRVLIQADGVTAGS